MTTAISLSNSEATIPVWAPGTWGEVCTHIPVRDIRTANHSTGALIDVVYVVTTKLHSGHTVEEVRTGESNINKLVKALGWYPRKIEAGWRH